MLQANPNHSEMYAQRWRNFVAEGKDIDGEARLIDAMSPRAARILDAGCGTGRVGGYLAARGHTVTCAQEQSQGITTTLWYPPGM